MSNSVPAVLTIWVIYKSPRDYPGKFVLRGQDVLPGQLQPVPHADCIVSDLLEDVRRPVRHLHRLERHPDDDPAIFETWI